LISGGTPLPGFDPEAGDQLQLNTDLVPSGSNHLKIVASGRALRWAKRGGTSPLFDDRTSALPATAQVGEPMGDYSLSSSRGCC
jgi:hypothetical protein